MSCDLNALFVSTTVCGMSSWFTHLTVVPGAIVISAGVNVKLSMLTRLSRSDAGGRLLREGSECSGHDERDYRANGESPPERDFGIRVGSS